MHRRDLTVAKTVVVLVTSAVLAAVLHGEPEFDQPFWALLLASTVLVAAVVGAYELGACGIAWVLSKVLPPPVARTAETVVPPSPSWLNQRVLGPKQALVLLGAYVFALTALWVALGVWAIATAPSGSVTAAQATLARVAPIGILGGYVLGGLAMVLLFAWHTRESNRATVLGQIGWRLGTARQVLIAGAAGLLIAVGYYLLTVLEVAPQPTEDSLGVLARTARSPGIGRASWAVAALLLAPPVEETLFRGGLLAGLERSWNSWTAAAFVTITFVALHLPETFHYWPATVAVATFAVAALAARRATGRLGPAISLHFGYNLGIVALALAAGPRAA